MLELLPMLGSVLALCSIVFIVFAICGLHLWKGIISPKPVPLHLWKGSILPKHLPLHLWKGSTPFQALGNLSTCLVSAPIAQACSTADATMATVQSWLHLGMGRCLGLLPFPASPRPASLSMPIEPPWYAHPPKVEEAAACMVPCSLGCSIYTPAQGPMVQGITPA